MGNMFSVLYCFIGSFFIFTCALASNETRNGNRSSINDCIHLTDKAQISRLGELFESKLVNIVDLRFSVDSDFNETIFHRMQLTLVNMVGLKITLWLHSYPYSDSKDFTSTLNAGRRSFELHANISYEGCVGRNLSSMDFVDSLLQELQGSSKLTTHEICYRKHVNSTQRCCKSINYPSETRCHEIREFSKSLNLNFIWLGIILSFMFTHWLTEVIYSSSVQQERQKYFEYYKLTESPMSLSSVISIVIWEEFEKYFALKKMIYEECRDHAYKEKHLETIRRQKGRNTKLVPVVSRKLYNEIRERLLPYHKSFFYYSVTVATLIIPLSTILYEELETLREIDVTPAISFLITLMIGALPYAYNLIIHARNGEDWRAAWKEEIKMNVKSMVQDNPDLAKTILVIRPDGTADDDGENDVDNGDDDESNGNDEQPEQEMVQDRTLYETTV